MNVKFEAYSRGFSAHVYHSTCQHATACCKSTFLQGCFPKPSTLNPQHVFSGPSRAGNGAFEKGISIPVTIDNNSKGKEI
jgi:hypothetical protein